MQVNQRRARQFSLTARHSDKQKAASQIRQLVNAALRTRSRQSSMPLLSLITRPHPARAYPSGVAGWGGETAHLPHLGWV